MIGPTLILLLATSSCAAGVDVVVVGSGMSGLAAARALADVADGCSSFKVTVLEAESRVGGRTYTNTNASGFTDGLKGGEVDYGASWIHGSTDANPITALSAQLLLTTFQTLDSKSVLKQCASSSDVPPCPDVDSDLYTQYEALLKLGQSTASTGQSLWASLDGESDRDDPIIQSHMANAAEFNTAGPMDKLNAKLWDNDKQFSGTEQVFLLGSPTHAHARTGPPPLTSATGASSKPSLTATPALARTQSPALVI